jgi:hypothetical protein
VKGVPEVPKSPKVPTIPEGGIILEACFITGSECRPGEAGGCKALAAK